MKLNTNGAVFGEPKKAGEGRVLQCSNGDWIAGFAKKLGTMTSTMAELWALKDGLSLAQQLNLQNINIELGANVLVHLLSNPTSINLMLEHLLNDCRAMVRSLPTAQ